MQDYDNEMENQEKIPGSPSIVPVDEIPTRSFEQIKKDSGEGGNIAKAYEIASAMYGGHPPADYVESVRQGLAGEDH